MDYTLSPEFPLLPIQQEGVGYVLARRSSILNYQTGGGKSYIAVTAALHMMLVNLSACTVIICPAGALKIFRKELKRLGVQSSSYTSEGVYTDPTARFHLFSYSMLGSFLDVIQDLAQKGPIIVILDEAHKIGDQTTKQTQLIQALRPFWSVIIALTATPLTTVNNTEALYHLVSYLEPGLLGPTYGSFCGVFLDTRWEKVSHGPGKPPGKKQVVIGVKRKEVLHQILSRVLLARHLVYDLHFHFHKATLTAEELHYYKQAGRGILGVAKGKDTRNFSARLHDLSRVVGSSHTSLPKEHLTKLSSKERLLVTVLYENILSQDMAAIIYAEHISTVNRLSAVLHSLKDKLRLHAIHEITGSVSEDERGDVEEILTGRDIVLLTKAGTESRNLQKANQVIFYDVPFAISTVIQCLGRVTRCDSKFTFQDVHIIEAVDTVDTYKRALMQDSAGFVKDFFGDNPNLPDVQRLDRSWLYEIRKYLLWSFKS